VKDNSSLVRPTFHTTTLLLLSVLHKARSCCTKFRIPIQTVTSAPQTFPLPVNRWFHCPLNTVLYYAKFCHISRISTAISLVVNMTATRVHHGREAGILREIPQIPQICQTPPCITRLNTTSNTQVQYIGVVQMRFTKTTMRDVLNRTKYRTYSQFYVSRSSPLVRGEPLSAARDA